jgi:peptidoglycan/LPS O-acetylase OafA/YrhL
MSTNRQPLVAGRIPELDGLRGIAILIVVVWHYGICQLLQFPVMGTLLKTPLGLGWSGVDLFFVLSGFLIGGILIDHRGSPSFFKTFYIRRSCRILPIYFLMVGILAVVVFLGMDTAPRLKWLFAKPHPLLSYATFTQTAPMVGTAEFGPHWLAVSWSLAIEEHFYLVLPLLICFCRPQSLPYLLGGLILLAPVLRVFFNLILSEYSHAAFLLMPCRADSLALGALAAWAVRKPAFAGSLRANAKGLHWILSVFAAGVVVLGITGRKFSSPIMSLFGYSWLAGFYCLLLLISLHHPVGWIARICRLRALQWVGVISYGIYLFHQAVSGLCHAALRGADPAMTDLSGVAITGLALLITFTLARLSFGLFEKPILNFGHRFKYDTVASAEPERQAATPPAIPSLAADGPA